MKYVAGKLMDVCVNCGKIVRIDKPISGSLHICTTEEEQKIYREQITARAQRSRAVLEAAK